MGWAERLRHSHLVGLIVALFIITIDKKSIQIVPKIIWYFHLKYYFEQPRVQKNGLWSDRITKKQKIVEYWNLFLSLGSIARRIESFQSKILCTIVNAPFYASNQLSTQS